MRPTSVVRKPLSLGNMSAFFVSYGVGSAVFLTLLQPEFGMLMGGPLGLLFAWFAWSARASDIVLDANGLTVVGRAVERRAMRWEEIQSSDVTDAGEAMEIGSSPVRRFYLRVMTASGVVLLGEGLGEDERDELQVIADCIIEAAKPIDSDVAAAPPQTGAASSLVCPNCGATIAPTDQAVTRCGSCDHDVTIPEQIQNLVRKARALAADRRDEEQTLSKVLRQPSATEVVLRQAAIFVAGMGSVAIWLTHVVPHYLGALAFLAAIVLLVADRRTMADRRAVRSIGRFFGAIAPAKKGAPATCRSCGAPLPVTEGTAVVACVFCNATNLLDVDLRSAASRAADVRGDLYSVLAVRQQQAKAALRIGILGIVVSLVPLAILSLRP